MSGWSTLAVLPAFGLDTLATAAGLGAAGAGDRRRLALVFAAFEGGMPILGAAAGHWLGRFAARPALWGAAALLAFLGVRELAEGLRELREDEDEDDEGQRPRRAAPAGWALLAAGLAVSADELGAGLASGAAHLPLRLLVPALALQAVLLTYAGLRAGQGLRRLAGRFGEVAAGVALLGAAAAVLLLGGP